MSGAPTDDVIRLRLVALLLEAGVSTDADDDRVYCERVARHLMPNVIRWLAAERGAGQNDVATAR